MPHRNADRDARPSTAEPDDRLAALEAQVAVLLHERGAATGPEQSTDGLGRRALLRRGGVALAGVAGTSLLMAAGAGSASAATGDALKIGASNDAGAATTTLTSASSGATLALENTTITTPAGQSTQSVAPLLLTPSAQPPGPSSGPVGSLMTFDGQLYLGASDSAAGTNTTFDAIYTSGNANTLKLISPVRLVDTRKAIGVSGTTPLARETTTVVDVATAAGVDAVAVFVNLTAVSDPAQGSGYLTAWSGGAKPYVSNSNYAPRQTIANFALVPVADGKIQVFNSGITHLLVDIFAAVVALPPAISTQNAARARRKAAQRG